MDVSTSCASPSEAGPSNGQSFASSLTEDATLEELREAARNLRALSSSSALADLWMIGSK
jgi:hypothetical protein